MMPMWQSHDASSSTSVPVCRVAAPGFTQSRSAWSSPSAAGPSPAHCAPTVLSISARYKHTSAGEGADRKTVPTGRDRAPGRIMKFVDKEAGLKPMGTR